MRPPKSFGYRQQAADLHLETCFFFRFTCGSLRKRLSGLHYPSRQRPTPSGLLNNQDFSVFRVHYENVRHIYAFDVCAQRSPPVDVPVSI